MSVASSEARLERRVWEGEEELVWMVNTTLATTISLTAQVSDKELKEAA